MAASVVLAFAALAFSEGWFAELDLFRIIIGVLTICLEQHTYDFQQKCVVGVPTKYPLLLCLITFAIGLLMYRGAISIPATRKNEGEGEGDSE
jgi:hypothetical protein